MNPLLIPLLVPIALCAMIFGLRYLTSKERMAMIERGISPMQPRRRSSRPLQSLKWGLVVCGVGLGLLLSFFMTNYVLMTPDEKAPAIYFALIGIFGGSGLVISYTFEKRHEEKEKMNDPH